MNAMNDLAPAVAWRVLSGEGLDEIRPLWEKLRAYHAPLFSHFPGEGPPFVFEPRKKGLLAKAAAGRIRVELASRVSDNTNVAYCVSTITADGCGEVDSLFVDECLRSRGIGGQLVRNALAWMDVEGASSKVVNVAHANAAALAFYAQFGFLPRTVLLQLGSRNTRGR